MIVSVKYKSGKIKRYHNVLIIEDRPKDNIGLYIPTKRDGFISKYTMIPKYYIDDIKILEV